MELQEKIAQIRAEAEQKIAAAEACARVIECMPAAAQPHVGFMYHHGGKQGTWVKLNKDPARSFRGPLFTLAEAVELLNAFAIEPTVAWVDGPTYVERKCDRPEGAAPKFDGRDYIAKVHVDMHSETSLIAYVELACGRVRIEIAFACPFGLRTYHFQAGQFGHGGRYRDCAPRRLNGAHAIQWSRCGDESSPADVDQLVYDMDAFLANES